MQIFNIIFFHKGKGGIIAKDIDEAVRKTKLLIQQIFGSTEDQVHVDTSGPWPVFSETMSYPDAANPVALLIAPSKGDSAEHDRIIETCRKQESEGYVALFPEMLMPSISGLHEVEIFRLRDGMLEIADRNGVWGPRT